jgi:hypothetical protein
MKRLALDNVPCAFGWRQIASAGLHRTPDDAAVAPVVLQSDFDKMQGGPTHCITESHCVVRSWKDFSLSKEQGEAS